MLICYSLQDILQVTCILTKLLKQGHLPHATNAQTVDCGLERNDWPTKHKNAENGIISRLGVMWALLIPATRPVIH